MKKLFVTTEQIDALRAPFVVYLMFNTPTGMCTSACIVLAFNESDARVRISQALHRIMPDGTPGDSDELTCRTADGNMTVVAAGFRQLSPPLIPLNLLVASMGIQLEPSHGRHTFLLGFDFSTLGGLHKVQVWRTANASSEEKARQTAQQWMHNLWSNGRSVAQNPDMYLSADGCEAIWLRSAEKASRESVIERLTI